MPRIGQRVPMIGLAGMTAGLSLGIVAGAVHFALLRWQVGKVMWPSPGAAGGAAALLAWPAIRFGLTGAALFLAAGLGPMPLLASSVGVLIARPVMLRVLA